MSLRANLARAVLAVALVAEAVVLGWGLRYLDHGDRAMLVETISLPLFVVALVALRYCGLRVRSAMMLVIGVGAVLQGAAVTGHVTASDDAYRYVWDAKVQLSGTDPYRYPPSARELDHLRTDALFPRVADCPPDRQVDAGRCSRLNRVDVRTVYPPVAQLAFVVARLASFGSTDGLLPLQVLAAVGVVFGAIVLARRALARNHPPWQVAIWAWCPITAVDLANNAHIDWLGAVLAAAALVAAADRRAGWAGALAGAAIVTKIYPGLILPSLLRRRPVRTVAAAVAVVALSYVPHVAAVGRDVIGYLPDYLKEESYTSGHRFLLVRTIVPDSWTAPVVAAVLLLAALWTIKRTDPDRPEDTAVVMVGVAFVLLTPNYSWYLVLLLILIAQTGRFEWLPLVVAASYNTLGAPHFAHGIQYRTATYAAGLLGVLVLAAVRLRRGRTTAVRGPAVVR